MDINQEQEYEKDESIVSDSENEEDALKKSVNNISQQLHEVIFTANTNQLKLKNVIEANAKLQKRVTELEEENSQFKETFNMLMKSVQELNEKNTTYENRLQDFEDNYNQSGDAFDESKPKYPSYQDISIGELESLTSSIDEPCIIIKYKNDDCKNQIEKKLSSKKKLCNFVDMNKDKAQYKITDIDSFMSNLETIASRSCSIALNKIEQLDINENITLSSNITFSSQTDVILAFSEKKSIIINKGAKVSMHKFHIVNCKNDGTVFNLKSDSSMLFKEGLIRNNMGKKAIFKVAPYATLDIEDVKFDSNIMEIEDTASCISADKKATVNINCCTFVNHTCDIYPFSSRLIHSKGHLNITDSLFEKNTNSKNNAFSIVSNGIGTFNIVGSNFIKCCPMNVEEATNVLIKNSHFKNFIHNKYVGCFSFTNCKNIHIQDTHFRNNHAAGGSAGAIFFERNPNKSIIMECTFLQNTVSGDYGNGGAIRFEMSPCKINDTEFNENKSSMGGAIYSVKSDIGFRNCIFELNTALIRGGAIYCKNGNLDADQNENNIFKGNKAPQDPDKSISKSRLIPILH